MKSSTFVILCEYKLDAHENANQEFMYDDLHEMIGNDRALIVTDLDQLQAIKKDNPNHKFEYKIKIESSHEES